MRKSPVRGVRFVRSSDQSLLVYFDADQGEALRQTNEKMRRLLRLLEMQPILGARNLHPAYSSLLVKFDALKLRHSEVETMLAECLDRLGEVLLPEPRLVEIPVCYGGEFGPDLEDVAKAHGITTERVIELHASPTYLVYFLGFVPGFAYLGELPDALFTPRHATPRRRVPAGSVGVASNQTGVYPCETPGGWRLLGRTPLALVRPDQENLSLLAIGDHVRFKPISCEQFASLREPQNAKPHARHSEPSAAP